MREFLRTLIVVLVIVFACGAIMFLTTYPTLEERGFVDLVRYRFDPDSVEIPVADGLLRCEGAPFINPTGGWTGVLYGDSIFGTTNHSGLDIFGLEATALRPSTLPTMVMSPAYLNGPAR